MKKTLLVLACMCVICLQGQNVRNLVAKTDSLKKTVSDTPVKHSTLDSFTQFKYSVTVMQKVPAGKNFKITTSEGSGESSFWKYFLPIFTLLLGIAVNKTLDYFKDRKNYKRSANRWIAGIASMEFLIKMQIDHLTHYLEEEAKGLYALEDFTLVRLLNGEVFKSLDKSDLLNYLEKIKGRNFQNSIDTSNMVNGFIDILPDYQKNLVESFESYKKETSSLNTQFSIKLGELSRGVGEYAIALEAELGSEAAAFADLRLAPIIQLFDAEIKPKADSGQFDVFAMEAAFYDPIKEHMVKLRHDPRAASLGAIVAESLTLIKRLRYERFYLRNNIEKISGWYNQSLGEIPGIVAALR